MIEADVVDSSFNDVGRPSEKVVPERLEFGQGDHQVAVAGTVDDHHLLQVG